MKKLYFIWIMVICVVVLVSTNYQNEATNFHGIAGLFPLQSLYAAESVGKTTVSEPLPTDIMGRSGSDFSDMEASGILFLEDLKKYLVISDDTENNKPVLHLMNHDGVIEDEIMIRGAGRIDDMEAITQGDNHDIYIACSQSYNKKGKLKDERKLLVKIERNRSVLTLKESVYLFDLLKQAAKADPFARWAGFMTAGKKKPDINIEGIFYRKGNLYLGFKSPFSGNRAVILVIEKIDSVLKKKRLDKNDLRIWKKLDLRVPESGLLTRLSDLFWMQDRLYVLSCADKKKKRGFLWVCDPKKGTASIVRTFEGLRPEGVSYNPDSKEFIVTFDQGGKKPSKMIKIRRQEETVK